MNFDPFAVNISISTGNTKPKKRFLIGKVSDVTRQFRDLGIHVIPLGRNTNYVVIPDGAIYTPNAACKFCMSIHYSDFMTRISQFDSRKRMVSELNNNNNNQRKVKTEKVNKVEEYDEMPDDWKYTLKSTKEELDKTLIKF